VGIDSHNTYHITWNKGLGILDDVDEECLLGIATSCISCNPRNDK
jgi:hypothetical protein